MTKACFRQMKGKASLHSWVQILSVPHTLSWNTFPLPPSKLLAKPTLTYSCDSVSVPLPPGSLPWHLSWVQCPTFDSHHSLDLALDPLYCNGPNHPLHWKPHRNWGCIWLACSDPSAWQMVDPQYILLDEQLCNHIHFFFNFFYCRKIHT